MAQLGQHFIREVLDDTDNRCRILVAPPGSGKSTTAVSLVSELIDQRLLTRGIVIAPGGVARQLAYRIGAAQQSLPVHFVDRRTLRELHGMHTADDSPWPERGVVVLSLEFFRQEDVASLVSGATWDLVLVDEADRVRGRCAEVLSALVEEQRAARMLLLASTPPRGEWLEAFAVTDWRPQIREWSAREQARMVVAFSYTNAELTLLRRFDAFVVHITEERGSAGAWGLFRRAAVSSFYSGEQQLQRIRHHLNQGQPVIGVPHEAAAHDPGTIRITASGQPLIEIDAMLDLLDALDQDSKLEALKALLRDRYQAQPWWRVVIFVEFSDTAIYLQSALADEYPHVHKLVPATLPAETETIVASLKLEGGILIVTDAAARNLELGTASTLVHYDETTRRDTLQFRESRGDFVSAYILRAANLADRAGPD